MKSQAIGGASGGASKGKLLPEFEDKDKVIEELKEKLLQAEKNKEILQKANDSEIKSSRVNKARNEALVKELNMKIEKLEQELRERNLESRIASTKIRELQSSGNGLPIKREKVDLKPLNHNPGEKAERSGRFPSVSR